MLNRVFKTLAKKRTNGTRLNFRVARRQVSQGKRNENKRAGADELRLQPSHFRRADMAGAVRISRPARRNGTRSSRLKADGCSALRFRSELLRAILAKKWNSPTRFATLRP